MVAKEKNQASPDTKQKGLQLIVEVVCYDLGKMALVEM